MVNPYRGEAEIEIDGRTLVLWYGWPGVAMLRAELGDDFDVSIAEAMAAQNLSALAKILAIGLRESWPGITAEEVERLSPPIARTVTAVGEALRRTYQGNEEVRDEPDANPPSRWRRAANAIRSWLAIKPRSLPA